MLEKLKTHYLFSSPNILFFYISITDAFNETKDKVKYLDSLKRYFEQLYLPNITVSILSNTVLPGLMSTVRQMDAISRYYARTGYLGVLFTKVDHTSREQDNCSGLVVVSV